MKNKVFEDWLNGQPLSETSRYNYLRGIRYIKKDLSHLLDAINKNSVYEIEDINIINNLLNSDEFITYDRKGNRMCSSALKKYKEFLKSREIVVYSHESKYREWLQVNTTLTSKTIGGYISAIRSLKNLLLHLTENGNEFDLFKITNNSKLDEIMNDSKFKAIDEKWNKAHTAAIKYYKKYLASKESDSMLENIVLIKINKSYKENMTSEELYQATSFSWVASFEKTDKRDIQYYCSVYKNEIIEVYKFLGAFEEIPRRTPPRFILQGEVADEEIRQRLLGIDVNSVHKGSGNPIKYTNLNVLLNLEKENIDIDEENYSDESRIYENVEKKELIIKIQTYITSKGFNYSEANIKNLYLSLRSKPFVIISGISGTGKTKIMQLFAESIGATEDNGQFTLIPVRPDWSDGSELLGYKDIKGDFIEGPLTKVVREASDNLDRPYFVLLDEMNLARVEYYFSDVLSVMESRKKDGDTYTSLTLIEIKDKDTNKVVEKLTLPNNLYIIGTVNMDETTHPFSKKVLDRANTIEFNEIDLNTLTFLANTDNVEPILLANSSIEAKYVQLKDCYESNKTIIEHVSKELTIINEIIEQVNAHVGYRVRDEICFYMIYNNEGSLFEEDEAFDYCIMQKILPRLAGSGQKIHTALERLFKHLTDLDYDENENEVLDATSVRYPLSAKKVDDMLRRLRGVEGFTSFWNS